MPQKPRNKLPPLDLGPETMGQRLRRLRLERGLTQVQLGAKVGITQILVCNYERGRLNLSADMAVRLAIALEVSTDQLLGLDHPRKAAPAVSLNLLRRLERIERLPLGQRKLIVRTIDTLIKGVGSQAA